MLEGIIMDDDECAVIKAVDAVGPHRYLDSANRHLEVFFLADHREGLPLFLQFQPLDQNVLDPYLFNRCETRLPDGALFRGERMNGALDGVPHQGMELFR